MTSRSATRLAALLVVLGAVTAAAVVAVRTLEPAHQATAPPIAPPTAPVSVHPPPQVAEVPGGPVAVAPGDDLAELAVRYPPGTAFLLAPGVHRVGEVIARDGQRFTGEPGAVLNGSVVLAPEDFEQDAAGRWWIGGQVQQGLVAGEVEPGHERDRHPEEVFVDGDRRLRHVAELGQLAEGAWHFDYGAARIYLHDDPASFALVETSVHAFALGGTAVRDVVVEELVVEKYASPHYYGALGGAEEGFPTFGWTYRGVTARYNHGGGIVVGPGTTIEGSRVHHNGQIGVVGVGRDPYSGYAAPVVLRDTEIDHNLQLGFRWSHEGGGTKFKDMAAGMVAEGNWVHDNAGPGLWWDVYNAAVEVRGNLVERNAEAGIFYEIGSGPAVITGNLVTGNGGAGIQVSTSQDVRVEGNAVWANGDGMLALHDQEQIGERFPQGLVDVVFADNDVWADRGRIGVEVYGGEAADADGVRFVGNRYRMGDAVFRWLEAEEGVEAWRRRFPDDAIGPPAGDPPETRAEEVRRAAGVDAPD